MCGCDVGYVCPVCRELAELWDEFGYRAQEERDDEYDRASLEPFAWSQEVGPRVTRRCVSAWTTCTDTCCASVSNVRTERYCLACDAPAWLALQTLAALIEQEAQGVR